jgi:hypothetical protein
MMPTVLNNFASFVIHRQSIEVFKSIGYTVLEEV